ncbi:MAG: D-amino-acid transaminase [Alphaproteobacteria bacterium]|nr:D-amino-acid transaminase [Alphaproteobacteria bacterium]
MYRIAYVNGRYQNYQQSLVHAEDRGYQFGDGIYEVVGVRQGMMISRDEHLNRLQRSLAALDINLPYGRATLTRIMSEVMKRNHLQNGLLYMQVTRGVASRDHVPPPNILPSLVVMAKRMKFLSEAQIAKGISVISQPDLRWGRCDIKTIGLLPNALAKQQAVAAGAFEAWLVDEQGHVTEGSSTNAWIITKDNILVTRPLDKQILAGVTRQRTSEFFTAMSTQFGIRFEQRPFTLDEAHKAREAFITSASNLVVPVVKLNGKPIGDGRSGPTTLAIRHHYLEQIQREMAEHQGGL